MDSKEIIKVLETNGWMLVAVKGSQFQFRHHSKTGRVTVPHPRKDLPNGTFNSILKQAELK
jgi:predicted RNA binding protein YcfA (HicA-like mRNA interferase family)